MQSDKQAAVVRPTDEEILAMDRVSVAKAASYLATSTSTIHAALIQQRAPYGYAVYSEVDGTWSYHISPGLLVAYKRGTIHCYKLQEVIKLAADGISELLSEERRQSRDQFARIMDIYATAPRREDPPRRTRA